MNGLRYIREQYNLSGSALAKKMTISQPTVFEWEHGKRKIPPARLKQLSDIFNIPQKYFGEISNEEAEVVYAIIQINKRQPKNDFKEKECNEAIKNLKQSIQRIHKIAKSKPNKFDYLSDYTRHINQCAKVLNQFAEVLELYGTDLKLQYCLSAFIRAKNSETNLADELKKAIEIITESEVGNGN